VSKFGSGHQESIITKKKGKLDINEPLHFATSSWKGMMPSSNKYYRVKESTIYNIITIVIREYTAFSKNKLSSIRLVNTDFSRMIPKLKRWLQIDFSMLRKPRSNYKNQTQINPHESVWQMQPWFTLALIQEDSCDRWVVNTPASFEMHTQP
jgi:hypothetical protein